MQSCELQVYGAESITWQLFLTNSSQFIAWYHVEELLGINPQAAQLIYSLQVFPAFLEVWVRGAMWSY